MSPIATVRPAIRASFDEQLIGSTHLIPQLLPPSIPAASDDEHRNRRHVGVKERQHPYCPPFLPAGCVLRFF
jgi:hypothetical protein